MKKSPFSLTMGGHSGKSPLGGNYLTGKCGTRPRQLVGGHALCLERGSQQQKRKERKKCQSLKEAGTIGLIIMMEMDGDTER